MRPQEVLYWLRAQPFQPFRITMNSGRSYEVRHPELVRVMRASLVLFTPTDQPDVFEHAEMIGLVLIERIEPLPPAQPAPAPQEAPPGQGE